MNVLVTGGAGYIGSHTCVELIQSGHAITIADNLVNGSASTRDRIFEICGIRPAFHILDLCDKRSVERLFAGNAFDAVLHFAGLKAVGESAQIPLEYYRNNIGSTITLCEVMADYDVRRLIFSSSATVYGDPPVVPVSESSPVGLGITSPYGQTKFMIEQILRDLAHADSSWRIGVLRYFNPVGAHESGLIGEDPEGIPTNLFPYVSRVAAGRLERLRVFGADYPTHDGTGIRDYIHVVDLALGHLAALRTLGRGINAYNLGTGKGNSVLEVIRTFEAATGSTVPYTIVDRRPGDVAVSFADCSKANRELNWRPLRSLAQACADTWRWQSRLDH